MKHTLAGKYQYEKKSCMHAHTKTNSLVLALSQDTREGGKHNIHRYLKNNQKGARGRNRFGCAARLSQQLPLIIFHCPREKQSLLQAT